MANRIVYDVSLEYKDAGFLSELNNIKKIIENLSDADLKLFNSKNNNVLKDLNQLLATYEKLETGIFTSQSAEGLVSNLNKISEIYDDLIKKLSKIENIQQVNSLDQIGKLTNSRKYLNSLQTLNSSFNMGNISISSQNYKNFLTNGSNYRKINSALANAFNFSLNSEDEQQKEILAAARKFIREMAKAEEYVSSINNQVNEISVNLGNTTAGKIKSAIEQQASVAEEITSKESQNLSEAIQSQQFDTLAGDIQNTISQYFSFQAVLRATNVLIREATAVYKDLDKELTSIAMVTNSSRNAMWNTVSTYNEMALELGATTIDIVKTSALFYQQGRSTSEVMDMTRQSTILARISGLDYATSTQYLTAAMNGYNIAAEDSQIITDTWAELAARAAVDVSDLAEALSKVSSLAANAGMDIQTTSAFLTKMIETTQEAPTNLGTALKTVIARFQELTVSAEELGDFDALNKVDTALASAGVSLKNAEGEFRAFDDVILELSSKWDTLDINTQRYIATTAAGSRQQSRFIALVEDYERNIELIEMAQNSANASLVQFNIQADSYETSINRLTAAWEGFYTSFDAIGPIKAANNIFADMLSIFSKFPGWLNATVAGFGALSAIFTANSISKGIAKFSFDKTKWQEEGAFGFINAIINSVKDDTLESSKEKINSLFQTVKKLGSLGSASEVIKTLGTNFVSLATKALPVIGIIGSVSLAIYLLTYRSNQLRKSQESLAEALTTKRNYSSLETLIDEYKELSIAGEDTSDVISRMTDLYPELRKVMDNTRLSSKQLNEELNNFVKAEKLKALEKAFESMKEGLNGSQNGYSLLNSQEVFSDGRYHFQNQKKNLTPEEQAQYGEIYNLKEVSQEAIDAAETAAEIYIDIYQEKFKKTFETQNGETITLNTDDLTYLIVEGASETTEEEITASAKRVQEGLKKLNASQAKELIKWLDGEATELPSFLDVLGFSDEDINALKEENELQLKSIYDNIEEVVNRLNISSASEMKTNFNKGLLSSFSTWYADSIEKLNELKVDELSPDILNFIDEEILDFQRKSAEALQQGEKLGLKDFSWEELSSKLEREVKIGIENGRKEANLERIFNQYGELIFLIDFDANEAMNSMDNITQTFYSKIETIQSAFDEGIGLEEATSLTETWNSVYGEAKKVTDLFTIKNGEFIISQQAALELREAERLQAIDELNIQLELLTVAEEKAKKELERLQIVQNILNLLGMGDSKVGDFLASKIREKESEIAADNKSIEEMKALISAYEDDIYNTTIDLSKANDELTDAYEAQLKLIEQQKDALQDQYDKEADLAKRRIEIIQAEIDKRIEALEAEKEALQEKNDEEEEALELAKKQEALANALKNKTQRTFYAGRGWIWESNQSDLQSAREDLLDYRREQELQAALDAIDKEIEKLEDLKDAWDDAKDDIGKSLEEKQQELEWEKEFSEMTYEEMVEDLANFVANEIPHFQSLISQINSLTAAYEELAAAQAGVTGVSSSGSTSNTKRYNIYSSGGTLALGTNNLDQAIQAWEDYYQWFGTYRKQGFSQGGINDFTGAAALHGTPSRPEMVLNNSQAAGLFNFIKGLVNVPNYGSMIPNLQNNNQNQGTIFSNCRFEINSDSDNFDNLILDIKRKSPLNRK